MEMSHFWSTVKNFLQEINSSMKVNWTKMIYGQMIHVYVSKKEIYRLSVTKIKTVNYYICR
jgi:hypothetical protein